MPLSGAPTSHHWSFHRDRFPKPKFCLLFHAEIEFPSRLSSPRGRFVNHKRHCTRGRANATLHFHQCFAFAIFVKCVCVIVARCYRVKYSAHRPSDPFRIPLDAMVILAPFGPFPLTDHSIYTCHFFKGSASVACHSVAALPVSWSR